MSYVVSLTVCDSHYNVLKQHLFPGDGKEAAAMALCGRQSSLDRTRLLLREVHPVPYAICTRRETDSISWPVEWLDDLVDRAAAEDLSLVKFHSHPIDYRQFSSVDDRSDARLFPGIHALVDRDIPHASVVLLPDGSMFGRTVGPEGEFTPLATINMVGDDLAFWRPKAPRSLHHSTGVGRNTPAFGRAMSAELCQLSAAVVGCSGTGSIVVEQLARLGLGRLILIDPERVEVKNLNRIVNATWQDAIDGREKVEVARRAIAAVGLGTAVESHHGNLVDRKIVQAVANADLIFGCVDSAEARDVLNRISSQYLLPYFDVGVRIGALPDGTIDQIDGVIHYVKPAGASLLSRSAYRPSQVAADALRRANPALYDERRREKYIEGADEEMPAVISLNMTMASLVVNECLARLYRTRNQPNHHYAFQRVNLAEMEIETEPEGAPCPAFRPLVGRGDTEPLLDLPELSA